MKLVDSQLIAIDRLMPWDRAKKLFPIYNEDQATDFQHFLNEEDGEIRPLVVSEEFFIVDGYNRWRIAEKADVKEVWIDVYHYANEDEMERHAIVLNAKRRHLDSVALARAAARYAELLKPKADAISKKRSDAGKAGGRGKKANTPRGVLAFPKVLPEEITPQRETLGPFTLIGVNKNGDGVYASGDDVRFLLNKDMDGGTRERYDISEDGSVSPIEPRAEDYLTTKEKKKKRKESTTERAAKEVGVSQHTVRNVAKVDASGNEDLIKAMEQKEVSTAQAAKLVNQPEDAIERTLQILKTKREKPKDTASHGELLSGACIDCHTRLTHGFTRLNLNNLTTEEAKRIIKMLYGVGDLIASQIKEIQKRIES